jgi:hypothetical protein
MVWARASETGGTIARAVSEARDTRPALMARIIMAGQYNKEPRAYFVPAAFGVQPFSMSMFWASSASCFAPSRALAACSG